MLILRLSRTLVFPLDPYAVRDFIASLDLTNCPCEFPLSLELLILGGLRHVLPVEEPSREVDQDAEESAGHLDRGLIAREPFGSDMGGDTDGRRAGFILRGEGGEKESDGDCSETVTEYCEQNRLGVTESEIKK